jgi:hypothetical protein
MVVYNSNEKEETTPTARYAERIKGVKTAKNVITGESLDLSKLTIGPKSTLVLELGDGK